MFKFLKLCHVVPQRTDDIDGSDVTLMADHSADCTSDLFSVHDFDIKIDLDVPLCKFGHIQPTQYCLVNCGSHPG